MSAGVLTAGLHGRCACRGLVMIVNEQTKKKIYRLSRCASVLGMRRRGCARGGPVTIVNM